MCECISTYISGIGNVFLRSELHETWLAALKEKKEKKIINVIFH